MRRRRFQKPKIRNVGGYWIAQFRDLDGTKRRTSLGPVSKVKKYDAGAKLAKILEPINTRLAEPSPNCTFGQFINQSYPPFYKRKWKPSTAASNQDRLRFHLTGPFEDRALSNFTRDDLQAVLDEKAAGGLSYIKDNLSGNLRGSLGPCSTATDGWRCGPHWSRQNGPCPRRR